MRQTAVQRRFRQVCNGPQQGEGHLCANHGSGLEQALLLGRQAVDAGGQHRLHCRRHLNAGQRLGQAMGAPFAHQHPALHQGAHTLFQEKRIPFGARDQELLECVQAGVVAQQRLEKLLGAGGRQRVQAQLRVVGLAAPGVLVLGAVVDQQQEAHRR
jgi:hypothetical protein